jgi:hypothetical protein
MASVWRRGPEASEWEAWRMASVLRGPAGPQQQALLRAIGEPFIATAKWPVWQYVGLTLENEHGLAPLCRGRAGVHAGSRR